MVNPVKKKKCIKKMYATCVHLCKTTRFDTFKKIWAVTRSSMNLYTVSPWLCNVVKVNGYTNHQQGTVHTKTSYTKESKVLNEI